ncbi:uncharacterized protein LOC125421720 [Ziziphus jujuba]|uniref:Uncharacterized protein LOC125421720 n=1 Tax=Ziziphus jujuba TaxID=326968 RepID=A0ABM3IF20_ZIZJJ|nr:uncharacterized protein LOC125421720 [Ziziphus jujuba]
MAGRAMFEIPVTTRRRSDNEIVGLRIGRGGAPAAVSLTGMVFGFLDDADVLPENTSSSSDGCDDVDEEEEEDSSNVEENKVFWEEQEQLLQATLCRSSSIESKIRQATKEALRETNSPCSCRRPVVSGCRNCLQREICNRLLNLGYNSAICRSKWQSSSSLPSGQHSYLEVVEKSSSNKKEVRVVIELNFRAEFEMARASDEYNRLISRLPEVFVGKAERLRTLIKILCAAAKTCMKEKKMHLGPWRKHKYMQAKWLGSCERSAPAPLPVRDSHRPIKPRASMLTFDLLETLPGLHCTAVEVV